MSAGTRWRMCRRCPPGAASTARNGRKSAPQKRSPLLRPDQFHAIPCAHPGISSHAAYGVQSRRIDAEIVEKVFAYMEPHDFAQHDPPAAWLMAGVDHLEQFALHLRGRLGHPR